MAGKRGVLHHPTLYVGAEDFVRTVGTAVVIDIKLLHALTQVPLYPFAEVGALVLGYGADGKIAPGLRVVALHAALQPPGTEEAVAQDATPAVARHLVGNEAGYDFGKYLVHGGQSSKDDFSGRMLSKAALRSSITCS